MIKENFIRRIKENKSFLTMLFCCVLLLFLATLTLVVTGGNVEADDLYFHSARIEGVANAMRAGQFPIKYYSDWYYGGGYFSSIFYGDFFLIFPAILRIIGFSLKSSFWIYCYVVYFSLFISMYFLANKYLKNKSLAVVSATVFVLSQYMFVDVFRRSALGECVAIIFFIIMLIGVFNMLHEDYSKPWLYSVAFLGMLLSHMTTLIVATITLVLIVLCNSKKLFKDKKFWCKSLLAVGAFVLVGLYSLCSFVEMYFSDVYEISIPWAIPSNATQDAFEMLGFTSPYGVGIIIIVVFALRFFVKKTTENTNEVKMLDKFLTFSVVMILFVSPFFPWKYLDKICSFLQFPFRLNFIISIMLALAFAIEIKHISKTRIKLVKVILCCLAVFVFYYNNMCLFNFYVKPDINHSISTRRLEWTPVDVDYRKLEKQNVYTENGIICDYERKEFDTQITFSTKEGENVYYIPLIYYKGYFATITAENGEKINADIKKANNGLICINTQGIEGEVCVYYKGTTIQNVTFVISLLSVGIIAGFGTYAFVKKRKDKQNLLKNTEK